MLLKEGQDISNIQVSYEYDNGECPYCGFYNKKISFEIKCIFCKNIFSNVKVITEQE